MKPIKVGLLGLGVVGGGTWKVLNQNADEIARRAGRRIEVAAVAVRDVAKAKELVGDHIHITTDGMDVVLNPDIDVVVELVGGDTLAKDWVMKAIEQGKHVVTANKALLATHGNEVFAAAQKQNVMVAFEAAVAGGIPIIKAMREGLTANRIQWVAGIINGTTNFILSEMRSQGLSFADALADAQRLGYAEADPTFDIEGVDAAHKLSLLSSLAFGVPVQFDKAHIEGITTLAAEDIAHAERLGYTVKLLGITRAREQGIELRVHPTLVPSESMLANVQGAMNAVMVHGDAVGSTVYYGAGAGELPTASAVVADLVDVARLVDADHDHRVPYLAFQQNAMADTPIMAMDDVQSAYYLRLRVEDRPGVLADIARILADTSISIGSMFQEPAVNDETDIIFLTHEAREGDILNAILKIQTLDFVRSPVTRLRVETL
ncbi:MAG TPA: homoserine dehydrogenase [Paenalcaligenes hominis]|uniref:Homoserine dehydrogenase n=1 Tax=Paenalcaligenes hominis TaxID=643674 RepID=A0A1U9K278_9BURK|nr:homoserine dehydrogenase [Paenalcaligenes hominis]AQS52173.1 homoserine dehydrogenase [Paenalcaligenes hominis]NJB66111.1 homoserine dehydrogenase [Paenalcaligenes hominis]GGE73878.1 homoserine dehydrogenase [Paenalcaligenes hominis]HJH24202.1 homoserine dehydrogenase [Paenalcaligenes hominis]